MSIKIFYSFLIGLGIYLAVLGIFTLIKFILVKRRAKKLLNEDNKQDEKE